MSFRDKLRIAGDLFALPFRLVATGGGALIYFPRKYSDIPDYAEWLDTVERLDYSSRGLAQTAFLDVDPTSNPEKIWLLFGGNGSLALDWLPLISYAPESSDAFVMVDYPGYGFSCGTPSPSSIQEAIDDLVQTLLARFQISESDFVANVGVLGHSLGAAIAMDTAARYGIEKVILVSPFTTMKAMAEKVVGPIPARLLRHHFDNLTAIKAWEKKRKGPTAITVFHGTDDELIPFSMAEELASTFPNSIALRTVPKGDHNGILLQLRDILLDLMMNPPHARA